MDRQSLLELIGYIASILVAVSLMMSSILRLRLINLIGSALFATYGYLIGAWPVAAVNAFIACVNVYFLAQMLGSREYFRLLPVRPDSDYVRYFIDFNRAQIRRYQPDFDGHLAGDDIAVFVLRDLVPAGLLVGAREEGSRLRVKLDYAIPGFRDFKIGSYVYADPDGFFQQRDIRQIEASALTAVHARYLRRMGFAPTDAPARYSLPLHGSAGRRG